MSERDFSPSMRHLGASLGLVASFALLLAVDPQIAGVLSPALALLLPLLNGVFVGERLIGRVRAERMPRRPPAPRAVAANLPRAPWLAARSTRAAIAFALANRPPPALS